MGLAHWVKTALMGEDLASLFGKGITTNVGSFHRFFNSYFGDPLFLAPGSGVTKG